MKARWAAVLLGMVVFGADSKRAITEKDLYAFHWVGSPQISPDGAKVVYTLVKVAANHDDYETALWIAPTSGGPSRQLTSGPRDSAGVGPGDTTDVPGLVPAGERSEKAHRVGDGGRDYLNIRC